MTFDLTVSVPANAGRCQGACVLLLVAVLQDALGIMGAT